MSAGAGWRTCTCDISRRGLWNPFCMWPSPRRPQFWWFAWVVDLFSPFTISVFIFSVRPLPWKKRPDGVAEGVPLESMCQPWVLSGELTRASQRQAKRIFHLNALRTVTNSLVTWRWFLREEWWAACVCVSVSVKGGCKMCEITHLKVPYVFSVLHCFQSEFQAALSYFLWKPSTHK